MLNATAIFHSEAFDPATRVALAQIMSKGKDCFGETISLHRSVEPDCVLRCLSEKPMRVRQIAVRTQTHRDAVAAACETLLRTHQNLARRRGVLFPQPTGDALMAVFYRFVPRERIDAFKAAGWHDCGPTGGAHGFYSHTMKFLGDERPLDPPASVVPNSVSEVEGCAAAPSP